MDILLYPCKVQGEGAAESICAGIRALNAQDVDVIIVGRGGGSLEDLWAFNEESVVRAVYASRIPIISAVGHETDFALSDFAADVRASTPSNAAELAVLDVRDAMQHVDSLASALHAAALHQVEIKEKQLAALRERAALRNAHLLFDRQLAALGEKRRQLDQCALSAVNLRSTELAHLTARLRALDPEQVLRRGYALARIAGDTVTRVGQAKEGDALTVRVSDGRIHATVTRTEELQ